MFCHLHFSSTGLLLHVHSNYGHIMSLACLSRRHVRVSNLKTKRAQQTKVGVNVPQGGSNQCATFGLVILSGLGLRLHSSGWMAA